MLIECLTASTATHHPVLILDFSFGCSLCHIEEVLQLVLCSPSQISQTAHLIPHVPLGLLSLGAQLGSKSDLVHSALLYLSVNRLFYPFHFFLKLNIFLSLFQILGILKTKI